MNNRIKWQLTESAARENIFIDGSTEIFKSGKWAFLTREVIQNSLDALSEDQNILKMSMSLDDISIDSIPDKESIIKHINGTLSIHSLPERCEKFSKHALEMLNQENVRILKISDYNTTGVTGSEKRNGDTESAWNALIYDEGNSIKQSDTSTGSFGTGKNAPFALSGLNMVFYVTKDRNNKFAVEGVAKLHTSYVDGKKLERKIYYAKYGEDDQIYPLNYDECHNNLNKIFWREEQGSDVIIVGIDFDKEKIKREIVQSVVENFFVLINDERLEIDVFGEYINKDSLWNIIDKYCDKPIEYTNSNIKYGFIRHYLSTYSKIYEVKDIRESVTGAGNLRLIIANGPDIKGKWVAMFRNSGMKIFDSNIRTAQQNYSALFFPGDDDVDKFLRKIENPTHDFFDPEVRIQDKHEKALAIARYNQIKNWIKQQIEDYTRINVVDNDYLDGMEEYIQLDDSETQSNIVKQPEVELIEYESKEMNNEPLIESRTANGKNEKSEFEPDDGKSKRKHKFTGTATNQPGTEKQGLIRDYHNKFKLFPKVSSSSAHLKIAFSLDDYSKDAFNIEIETIGEDNSVSDYMPKIRKAIDLNTREEIKVDGNKLKNIPNEPTHLIAIDFDRKLDAKYKVSIYSERDEDNEI
jgi:hypothetical protein